MDKSRSQTSYIIGDALTGEDRTMLSNALEYAKELNLLSVSFIDLTSMIGDIKAQEQAIIDMLIGNVDPTTEVYFEGLDSSTVVVTSADTELLWDHLETLDSIRRACEAAIEENKLRG